MNDEREPRRLADLLARVLDESPEAEEAEGQEAALPYDGSAFVLFISGLEVLIDLDQREVRL